MELLKSGTPSATVDVEKLPAVTIVISQDDDEETKIVKKNLEFTTNTVRDAIQSLQLLGEQTGSPRYFETIATLLNTLSGANGQLLRINEAKAQKKPQGTTEPNGSGTKGSTTNVLIMSGREALKDRSTMKEREDREDAEVIDNVE